MDFPVDELKGDGIMPHPGRMLFLRPDPALRRPSIMDTESGVEIGQTGAAQDSLESSRRHREKNQGSPRESSGMDKLQALYDESFQDIQEGNIITGEVVKINKDNVFVDIGYKSEGEIPASEFLDPDGNLTVKKGDKVEVVLIRKADETGYPILSKKRIQEVKLKQNIEEAFREGRSVKGKILSQVKGGYIVDIGLRAFLPASQVDLFYSGDANAWLNTEHDFRIVSYDRRQENVVLSRKVLLEEQRQHLRDKTIALIQEGAVLKGRVGRIMDYGLLVDLGGVLGLVHITNVSWGKTRDLSKSFQIGDEVTVKVLSYTEDKGRVSLGMKQLVPDPWPDIAKKYAVGERVEAPVVALKKYGAFLRLDEGIEGLIPTSDLSWTRKISHPSQVLDVGDVVDAVVTGLDSEKRQITLSKKDAEPNPWDIIDRKYPLGTVIEGQVKKITDFGIFIGIEEGVDGLVHQSDMVWDEPAPHPRELYEMGQIVQAVVISIDKGKQHFSLSIKHLISNPESH
jgi:small subunit ribosomal protein S1